MSDFLSNLQLPELDPNEFKCIVDTDIGELGSGLCSHVRLADHRTFGWVAISCFTVIEGGSEITQLKKKIGQQLQALQQTTNNHIVRIYGWVKWSESIGLVMEYMAGGNLGQFIGDDSDRLPLKVILRMGCDMSDGIAYMHNLPTDQRVVYGDLKPENVLLSPELHCKLGDFGCAQLIALTGSTITAGDRSGKTDMTLAYAAPEKIEDFNIPVKKELDTYSFGMLLYALLRGSPPYQHTSQESAFIELIKQGGRPDTTPIDDLKETLSNEDKQILETLQAVMKKCWQQDPSDRPTMIEVRDELQRLRRQQNDADIMKSVSEVLDTLSISTPIPEEHKFLPLHHFSPIQGMFVQGTVQNICNMPNVRQAAMECSTVKFTQAEPVGAGKDVQRSHRDDAEASSTSLFSRLRSFFVESDASASSNTISKPPSGRKPTLSEVFESTDSSALPSNVQAAQSLLKKYKGLVRKRKYEEVKTMTTEIASMIEYQIDATAKDVTEFGRKLREKKRFLESIAIFDAASVMFEKMKETEENLELIRFFVAEMMDTSEEMIRDRDPAIKRARVKSYVIPLMREKLRHIEDTSLVSEQFKCLQVCWVLHYIGWSEGLVREWEESDKTLRFALTRMKDVFKSDVMNYYIYGRLLNNLGGVCSRTSRFEEAASFYKQANDAFKAATDCNSEKQKEQSIELSENNLKTVQRKLSDSSVTQ